MSGVSAAPPPAAPPPAEDHLERHPAARPILLGLVDDTHPATADLAHHLVGADGGAGETLGMLTGTRRRVRLVAVAGSEGEDGEVDRGAEKLPGLGVSPQEVFDRGAQGRVAAARPVEEGAALLGRKVQRLPQERDDPLPAIGRRGRHHASAVSSTDGPAEKRNETILIGIRKLSGRHPGRRNGVASCQDGLPPPRGRLTDHAIDRTTASAVSTSSGVFMIPAARRGRVGL